MASQFTKCQVKALYDKMNTDGKEGLTALEVMKMMKLLCQADDAVSVQTYFDKYNKDGDNVLSFDEFYKAFCLKSNDTLTDKQLMEKFQEFDTDGSGYLEIEEVKELMKKSCMSTENLQKDMELMDSKQKDGKISFEEFKACICKK